MTEHPMTIDMGEPLREGEELLGVIVGSDEGMRVVWTPLFLALPRETRILVGSGVSQAADIVPPEGGTH